MRISPKITAFASAVAIVAGVIALAAPYLADALNFPGGNGGAQLIEIKGRTIDTYVDATAEIRSGISKLSAQGGGVLFFGPGKYMVTDTIVVPSNITIQGSGSGEVGPCMLVLGAQGSLNAQGKALLEVQQGARNVRIRNIELRSMTPGWNVYPRTDITRIREEQTTGIRLGDDRSSQRTSEIELENLRITNFTYAIAAGPKRSSRNPAVTQVRMRNISTYVNHVALHVNSLNAQDWDVQNLNVVEMDHGQYGVNLVRAGRMSFLQLSCASTHFNAESCMEIGQRSGELYFMEAHVEGPKEGFRITETSPHAIYFDNSAIMGTVERRSTLYTFGNRFFTEATKGGRIRFTGTGTGSQVYSCGDVFSTGNPYTAVPSQGFPGLNRQPGACNLDVSAVRAQFAKGSLSFAGIDTIARDARFNVKAYGAKGDGITDDTEAIRRALRDNPAVWQRSIIIFPEGRYRVSGTLALGPGIMIQGENGAIVEFTGTNRPLFQLRALQSMPISPRSLHIDNMVLRAVAANALSQNTTAIEISGDRGVSSDHSFSNLEISGFTRGFYVTHDTGTFGHAQPQVDSVAARNIRLVGNQRGMEFKTQNSSNWNLEDIVISGMQRDQAGVVINGGGHLSFRGLTCTGVQGIVNNVDGRAGACVSIERQSGIRIENMSARNTKHALYVHWRNGWAPFPIFVRDSDLTEGLYVAGKTYLLSANNVFADATYARDSGVTLRGSREVYFAATHTDSPENIFPGRDSSMSSCRDRMLNPLGKKVASIQFPGLHQGPNMCVGDVSQQGTKPLPNSLPTLTNDTQTGR